MTDDDNHITSSQEWSVTFTDRGKEKFRSLGGSRQLCEWSFYVSVPAREGRTEQQLVEEIRALGVMKIHDECQKYGLQISLEDLQSLNSHDYLKGSKQRRV